MTRTEILMVMHRRPARRLFYTMELGGSMVQLGKMECEGLLRSEIRYGKRGGRKRNWYLDEEQHKAISFMFADTNG